MPTSLAGADDDGAPPALPPGGRVTTVGADGEVVMDSSSSPSPEQIAAARANRVIDPPLTIVPGEVSHQPAPAACPAVAAALVEKFPAFDPAWPPKIKAAWFDDFRELMTIVRGD